jgi:2-polyprenyl-3-methyl-5-hydroxy-6-metoxy-1,4-benzoquinol methylase
VIDYEKYWNLDYVKLSKPKFNFIIDRVGRGERVIDFGCGRSSLAKTLIKNGIDAVAYDISKTAIEYQKVINVPVITDYEEISNFDHAVFYEVLEHVIDPERILSDFLSRNISSFFISVPNTGFWRWRKDLLFGTFPRQWAYDPSEHLRFWTHTDFITWLDGAGLRVKETHFRTGFPVLRDVWPNLFCKHPVYWAVEK